MIMGLTFSYSFYYSIKVQVFFPCIAKKSIKKEQLFSLEEREMAAGRRRQVPVPPRRGRSAARHRLREPLNLDGDLRRYPHGGPRPLLAPPEVEPERVRDVLGAPPGAPERVGAPVGFEQQRVEHRVGVGRGGRRPLLAVEHPGGRHLDHLRHLRVPPPALPQHGAEPVQVGVHPVRGPRPPGRHRRRRRRAPGGQRRRGGGLRGGRVAAAAVGRRVAPELDPARGRAAAGRIEAAARARRRGGGLAVLRHRRRRRPRVQRLEAGVPGEEVEHVEAAAEDAVVGDEEHRVARQAGTAGQEAAVEERHEQRRAADGGARQPQRAVRVGGAGAPAARPQRAARDLQRRRGDGQVEGGPEPRAGAPVREPGPRGEPRGEHRAEVGREREPQLGLGARQLELREPREHGHPGRPEVRQHRGRERGEGVQAVPRGGRRRRGPRRGARGQAPQPRRVRRRGQAGHPAVHVHHCRPHDRPAARLPRMEGAVR
ncbi:hypothetical protein PAHAL_6G234800 [Panicum hallii]|uniref:Uncharacterized protein n=1 Tax=Panicum hallii TaxID=206008 RepID=A0A2T8IHA5_9POAL|nr:hypothetical protein PAHAL_6G234800 [Panicum hallii]